MRSLVHIIIFLLIFIPEVKNIRYDKDIMNHFQFIMDFAEYYHVKWIILLKLNVSDKSYQALISLMKTSKYYFSILNVKDVDSVSSQIGEHKTMILYYPDEGEYSDCCSELNFIEKFYYHIIWLVISKFQSVNMKNSYIPFSSQFIMARNSDSGNNEIVLVEVYQMSSNSSIYSQILGTWSSKLGFDLTKATFFERRNNFNGEPVLMRPALPDVAGSATVNIPDFIPSIWRSLAKRLNATSNNTDDLSIAELDANLFHPRNEQLLPPMLIVQSILAYKETSDKEFNLNRYFDPFDSYIWFCLLGWLIISAVMLYLTVKLVTLTEENFLFYVLDSFFIYLQQGTQMVEFGVSPVVLKSVQLISSSLIFISYSSVLISFITITVNKPPFTNLEGILQNGKYNIVALEGKGYDIFKNSRSGIVKDLFIKNVEPYEQQPTDFEDAFRRVCFGPKKLLAEIALPLLPSLIRSFGRPCNLKDIRFGTLKMGYQVLPKKRFNEIFKICTTKLVESGSVGKIFWEKALVTAKIPVVEEFKSIELTEVSSLFIMYVAGFCISIFAVLTEFCWRINRFNEISNTNEKFQQNNRFIP